MHSPEKSQARTAKLAQILLLGIAITTVSAPVLAATEAGGSPPILSYIPTAGTTVNLSGVTTVGSQGSGQISIIPSGGQGSGTFATVGLDCTMNGANAAFFSVSPQNQSFTPTSASSSMALTCVAGASTRSATLTCNESPGGSTGPARNWPVNCPAGTVDSPPTLSYAPTPGSIINFQPSNALVGSTATAQIQVTPSGGSGTGGNATVLFGNCSISGETVPGTFGGFQAVNFSFVGSTTTPRTVNLTAQVRASAVTATLTCNESFPILLSPDGLPIPPRTWQLRVNAGTEPSRLSISKSASAQQVQVNGEFSYSIGVSNSGSAAENGIIVLDDVPSALTVLSADGIGWNCSINGNTVDCRRSTLVQNSSASFDIQVRAPATPRSVSNTARVTSQSASTPIAATAMVEIVAAPPALVDLRLDKRDSADPVQVGTGFSYFLEVSNVGDTAATGVNVTDVLPTGLTLRSVAGPGWVCDSAGGVNCTLTGSLQPGAASTLVVEVQAPSAAGSISNTATVRSIQGDSNVTDNTDREDTSITSTPPPPPIPHADLEISAQAIPNSALTGQTVELQLAVSNRGPDAATFTSLTGTLSAAFELISAEGAGWTCTIAGQDLSCTRPGLPANQVANLSAQTRIRPGATAVAEANFAVTSPVADPVINNNSTRVAVPYLSGGADVSIVKTDSADPVAAAAQYSYTLTVSNAGPEAASGVRVSDALPAALTLVSASGAGFSCANAGTTVNCDLAGNLAAGSSAAVTVTVKAPNSAQSISNEGVVSATTSDPNPGNNRSTQTTQVNDRNEQDLLNLLDEAAIDPASRAALPVVAAECADRSSALADTCSEIISAADDGRTSEVTDALRAIAPDEVLAQQLVLREISATQFFNVDARLNELRRGSGGFSLSGLTVNYGDQSIPLALAGDALQAALGFGDSQGGLISPWGFFINGNITAGNQDLRYSTGRVGVDYDSRGLTAGVDYRLNSRTVVGAALGYASFSSDVNSGSTLDAKSLLLTGYGSYYVNDRFYVDSRLTYGNVNLDQQRSINFRLGSTVFDQQAQGQTDATQFTLATSIGYHLNYGPWSVTPNAGLRYTHNKVDAFNESGANEFNVAYDSQSFSSTQLALGVQVSRAVSLSTGVLMPQFDLSLNNENSDDPSAKARLLNGNSSQFFRLDQDSVDSSYGTAGLGFVYLMANGRQAFVSYRHTFGNNDFDRGSLNIGGRFEF
jgi:uncharacterized repeat protein (TIGR01451 family)